MKKLRVKLIILIITLLITALALVYVFFIRETKIPRPSATTSNIEVGLDYIRLDLDIDDNNLSISDVFIGVFKDDYRVNAISSENGIKLSGKTEGIVIRGLEDDTDYILKIACDYYFHDTKIINYQVKALSFKTSRYLSPVRINLSNIILDKGKIEFTYTLDDILEYVEVLYVDLTFQDQSIQNFTFNKDENLYQRNLFFDFLNSKTFYRITFKADILYNDVLYENNLIYQYLFITEEYQYLPKIDITNINLDDDKVTFDLDIIDNFNFLIEIDICLYDSTKKELQKSTYLIENLDYFTFSFTGLKPDSTYYLKAFGKYKILDSNINTLSSLEEEFITSDFNIVPTVKINDYQINETSVHLYLVLEDDFMVLTLISVNLVLDGSSDKLRQIVDFQVKEKHIQFDNLLPFFYKITIDYYYLIDDELIHKQLDSIEFKIINLDEKPEVELRNISIGLNLILFDVYVNDDLETINKLSIRLLSNDYQEVETLVIVSNFNNQRGIYFDNLKNNTVYKIEVRVDYDNDSIEIKNEVFDYYYFNSNKELSINPFITIGNINTITDSVRFSLLVNDPFSFLSLMIVYIHDKKTKDLFIYEVIDISERHQEYVFEYSGLQSLNQYEITVFIDFTIDKVSYEYIESDKITFKSADNTYRPIIDILNLHLNKNDVSFDISIVDLMDVISKIEVIIRYQNNNVYSYIINDVSLNSYRISYGKLLPGVSYNIDVLATFRVNDSTEFTEQFSNKTFTTENFNYLPIFTVKDFVLEDFTVKFNLEITDDFKFLKSLSVTLTNQEDVLTYDINLVSGVNIYSVEFTYLKSKTRYDVVLNYSYNDFYDSYNKSDIIRTFDTLIFDLYPSIDNVVITKDDHVVKIAFITNDEYLLLNKISILCLNNGTIYKSVEFTKNISNTLIEYTFDKLLPNTLYQFIVLMDYTTDVIHKDVVLLDESVLISNYFYLPQVELINHVSYLDTLSTKINVSDRYGLLNYINISLVYNENIINDYLFDNDYLKYYDITFEKLLANKEYTIIIKYSYNTWWSDLVNEFSLEYEINTFSQNIKYIQTIEDLIDISNNLSYNYVLKNDIDLKNYPNIIIGSDANPFTGEFDGNYYTISNYSITSLIEYSGLFGVVQDAVISNLYLNKVDINVSSTGNFKYLGALVGYAKSNVVIKNIKVDGSIKSGNSSLSIAGILGGAASNSNIKINNVSSSINISANSKAAGIFAVALSGSSVEISNSFNSGNIISTSFASGIVSMAENNTIVNIINTYNLGGIITSSSMSSGIINVGFNVSIVNCYTKGSIISQGINSEAYGFAGLILGNLLVENSFTVSYISAVDTALIVKQVFGTLTTNNVYHYNSVNNLLEDIVLMQEEELNSASFYIETLKFDNDIFKVSNNDTPKLKDIVFNFFEETNIDVTVISISSTSIQLLLSYYKLFNEEITVSLYDSNNQLINESIYTNDLSFVLLNYNYLNPLSTYFIRISLNYTSSDTKFINKIIFEDYIKTT